MYIFHFNSYTCAK